MKTDRYTKVVLTVIAACLVLLVLERYQIVQSAHAKDSAQRVKIVDSVTLTVWNQN